MGSRIFGSDYRALVFVSFWNFANGRQLEFNEVMDAMYFAIEQILEVNNAKRNQKTERHSKNIVLIAVGRNRHTVRGWLNNEFGVSDRSCRRDFVFFALLKQEDIKCFFDFLLAFDVAELTLKTRNRSYFTFVKALLFVERIEDDFEARLRCL